MKMTERKTSAKRGRTPKNKANAGGDNLPAPPNNQPKGITPELVIQKKLANPNLSQAEIGKLLGVSRQAINQCLKKAGVDFDGIFGQVESFKKKRADLLAFKQAQILAHLSEEKMEKTSFRDLCISYGCLADKEQMARGVIAPQSAIFAVLVENAHRSIGTGIREIEAVPSLEAGNEKEFGESERLKEGQHEEEQGRRRKN
jgi:predicted transcriptional regulator